MWTKAKPLRWLSLLCLSLLVSVSYSPPVQAAHNIPPVCSGGEILPDWEAKFEVLGFDVLAHEADSWIFYYAGGGYWGLDYGHVSPIIVRHNGTNYVTAVDNDVTSYWWGDSGADSGVDIFPATDLYNFGGIAPGDGEFRHCVSNNLTYDVTWDLDNPLPGYEFPPPPPEPESETPLTQAQMRALMGEYSVKASGLFMASVMAGYTIWQFRFKDHE